MTSSILLRPPPHFSPGPSPSPSPSPSPVSTPLPGLQTDLSSSSSSTSSLYPDLHRASSARSTRRIRFAPLPEPDRDLVLDSDTRDFPSADPQSVDDSKPLVQPVPLTGDLPDGSVPLTPSISPDSAPSSIRSTPTIRQSPTTPSKNIQKSGLRLLRPFSFLRRTDLSPSNESPLFHSTSLPGSRNPSISSFTPHSSSVPSSPSLQSVRLPRISEDTLPFRRMSFFRARSGSSSSARPPRTPSPPPKRSDPSKSHHRSSSTGSNPAMKQVDGQRDWGQGFASLRDTATIAGSGAKKRRASSSALTPGAGGGRHTASVQKPSNAPTTRPSTAPGSLLAPPRKHVKMLNGRVYGAKRYAGEDTRLPPFRPPNVPITAQTLANPFANVRDDPEFVEWGYGGMGSVQASAGIGNEMWRGLQRSERGSALLAGSYSPSTPVAPGAGGGRGSGAHPISTTARRKMSDNVPECGMGNVDVGSEYGEDDGSGMGWLKKRRAEREAKARLEQEAKDLERKIQEKRKSGDSTMDASMYASTASTATSLTACTSAASTNLTTPGTSPLTSRSPSMTDLKLTSSLSSEPRDPQATPSSIMLTEQSSTSITAQSVLLSKDEHERILTAVRLSPNISSSSHKHERAPSSPIDTEAGASSSGEEGPTQGSDEEEEHGDADEEDEVQDVRRKTALGAGVEKICRHVDVEAR